MTVLGNQNDNNNNNNDNNNNNNKTLKDFGTQYGVKKKTLMRKQSG